MKYSCALGVLLVASSSRLGAADWMPVPSEDLALKAGRVDPKADAEVLLWDISVFDEVQGNDPTTKYKHFVRLKVFTDRGAKNFEAPKIEYSKGQHVYDVGARVIQPDGQTQEVAKDAIFDRVLEKKKGTKNRAVSFAVPGVKAGSIIEYRWRESHDDELVNNVILPAAREIPVERVVYHVKPLVDPRWPYPMNCETFNVARPEFKPEGRGVFVAELHNVPSFQDEDDAPSPLDVQPWLLIYYAPDRKETPDQFWNREAREMSASFKQQIKINGDVKSLAASLTGDAKSPDEQLGRLAKYCQKNLRNIYGSDFSDVDRQRFKSNNNTVDTLKRGVGTPLDIQLAFAALARASGFEAAMTAVSDREFKTFDKGLMRMMFLPYYDVAVNVDGKWKLYDISSTWLQPGKIRWQEEGAPALVLAEKNPTWLIPPPVDAKENKISRAGTVQLDEQGGIEGEITETRTGHPAEEWRLTGRERSSAERLEDYRKSVLAYFPGAELSGIVMPDPTNPDAQVRFHYHIKMEGYATRTGKRIIFAPALYEGNTQARYTSSERKNNVYFHYGWTEVNDYTIQTPEGFELDHADVPAPLQLAPVCEYRVSIRAGKTIVVYHRELTFGMNGQLLIPHEKYPALKALFDAIHQGDTHILTLKAAAPAPAGEMQ